MILSNFFSFFFKVDILEFDPVSLQKRDFRLSKRQFDKLVGINGLPNFIIDKDTGRSCYLAKKVTWTKDLKEIDWGWIHTPDCSPFTLLCFREKYDAWAKRFYEISAENAELKYLSFLADHTLGKAVIETHEGVMCDLMGIIRDDLLEVEELTL